MLKRRLRPRPALAGLGYIRTRGHCRPPRLRHDPQPASSPLGQVRPSAGRGVARRPHLRQPQRIRRSLFRRHGQGSAGGAGARLGLSEGDHGGCERDRPCSRGRSTSCNPRAEHVDRLDRGQRPVLGLGRAERHRQLRPAQDHLVLSNPGRGEAPSLRSGQSLPLSRSLQRALLRRADGPRSKTFRPLDRPAGCFLRARSAGKYRPQDRLSRRAPRSPGRVDGGKRRQADAGRTGFSKLDRGWTPARRILLRRAHRRGGLAPVPESRFRRRGTGPLGSEPVLRGPDLLQRPKARSPLPGRHVMRVLPRRSQSHQAAAGRGEA